MNMLPQPVAVKHAALGAPSQGDRSRQTSPRAEAIRIPSHQALDSKVRKDAPRRKRLAACQSAEPVRWGCITSLSVSRIAGSKTRGKLTFGTLVIPCVIGRRGMTRRKMEGDGASPVGCWAIVSVLIRADRMTRPRALLPVRTIQPSDGWCDDPQSSLYNRSIRLPATIGHEVLWRRDTLYDVIVVLDYNLRHPAKRRGSAIFVHLMAPDGAATAGCVAIGRDAMRRLLPRLRPGSVLRILG